VISESVRGAGRNRFSPNNGEIRYSLPINSRYSRGGEPEYRICEDIERIANLNI
jgi:hypothetical protein